MIFAAPALVDFVSPAFRAESMLNRPRVDGDGTPRYLDPAALGAPLYVRRSCMSDALRFYPDDEDGARTVAHVAAHGGERFFDRPDWRGELRRGRGRAARRVRRRRCTRQDDRGRIARRARRSRGAPAGHIASITSASRGAWPDTPPGRRSSAAAIVLPSPTAFADGSRSAPATIRSRSSACRTVIFSRCQDADAGTSSCRPRDSDHAPSRAHRASRDRLLSSRCSAAAEAARRAGSPSSSCARGHDVTVIISVAARRRAARARRRSPASTWSSQDRSRHSRGRRGTRKWTDPSAAYRRGSSGAGGDYRRHLR